MLLSGRTLKPSFLGGKRGVGDVWQKILVGSTTCLTPSTALNYGNQLTSNIRRSPSPLSIVSSSYSSSELRSASTASLLKCFSNTKDVEEVLADFLKADALISAIEEKLEIM